MALVFLGLPTAQETETIKEKVAQNFWPMVLKNLEDEPNQTKISNLKTYQLFEGMLPTVSSAVPVQYKIGIDEDAVTTEWEIVGYNKSIPERIKYKSVDGNIIYVPTIGPGGLLSAIGENTLVYNSKSSIDSIGIVTDASENIVSCEGNEIGGVGHTFGNNNPYDAPTTIQFDSETYSFAGYNMTLAPRALLAVKQPGNDQLFHRVNFHNSGNNRWSTSDVRTWLNGTERVAAQTWKSISPETTLTGDKPEGLLAHLPDQKFMNAIMPTVNRTWVHGSWTSGRVLDENQCEHVVDRFWLMGNGQINYNPDWLKDYTYDTSIFSGMFPESAQTSNKRIRRAMNSDGSVGTSAYNWWLRSAYSSNYYSAGYVYSDGYVSSGGVGSGYYGLLPCCIIG